MGSCLQFTKSKWLAQGPLGVFCSDKRPRLEAVALACPAQRGDLDTLGIGIGIGVAIGIAIESILRFRIPIATATTIPIPTPNKVRPGFASLHAPMDFGRKAPRWTLGEKRQRRVPYQPGATPQVRGQNGLTVTYKSLQGRNRCKGQSP